MRERIYLNNDWQFTQKFQEEWLLEGCVINEAETVRIPHTCKETPLHYFDESLYQMICGYRKELFAKEQWKGKRVRITFEGAAHIAEVFLNGEKLAEHRCGYTAFTVDLTGYLLYGMKNILVVRLNSREDSNIPPFGYVVDYMTYGGIYRNVYLEILEQDFMEDIFAKPEFIPEKQERGFGRGHLTLEMKLCGKMQKKLFQVSYRECGEKEYQTVFEQEYEEGMSGLEIPFSEVKGWYTDAPVLYEVRVQLYQDKNLLDEKILKIGFRNAVFQKDGFYLNGEKIKIRGLNRHQSYPYVGYAMPKHMQRFDADILKHELGLNAVRTSHYPQSHDFIDRCDELGLLVFTEMPGWQHIGDDDWKEQAYQNMEEMIVQYRNHPSIILWGVRINESVDDDAFYQKTNEIAHQLDSTRQTGGVRAHKKSSLLEDVYTYNDFSHSGENVGAEPKKNITSDEEKPYLVSEYNGHMFPTKSYDCEEHRVEHALRHANVLDAVAGEEDIAGSFGWCMFDYNTHKDFGSGDRVCYHGVMDMFRNPKMASVVYAAESEETLVLELSSSMDIGEHPACNRGKTYLFTNADSVKMYKNDRFIHEYTNADSPYKNLTHGPVLIYDFVGDALAEENFTDKQRALVKELLNYVAVYGMDHMSFDIKMKAAKLILFYHMNMTEAVKLYNKYVGDWGGSSKVYRFEAIKDGKVVKTICKDVVHEVKLRVTADHTTLREEESYDVAAIRIVAEDENGNILPYFMETIQVNVDGPAEVIGSDTFALAGGMGGTYIKTTGEKGDVSVTFSSIQTEPVQIEFKVEGEENE